MAANKNIRFVPTFESLEAREVATASPIAAPAPLLDYTHVQVFQGGAPVMIDAGAPQVLAGAPNAAAPMGANYADPLVSEHRIYVGLQDLRKGDILLNTTNAFLSNRIKEVTKSNYNHAAIYVGNGKVVEAIGGGVREITLQKYLGDKDIVRVMVLRNGNLSTGQQDAIASFASSKVGARYNIGGLVGAAVDFKPRNFASFDRGDYFCSQLVAAAYSSAGSALHMSLEQTPGNLADMVNRFNLPANFSPRLTSLGALFDQGFHRSALDGREAVTLDLSEREQQYLVNVISTRLNKDGGNFSVQLHRMTVDNTGNMRAHFTVTRAGIGSYEVTYSYAGEKSDLSESDKTKISIRAPRNGNESDIYEGVVRGMLGARLNLHRQYFSGQTALQVASQTAGRVSAQHAGLAQVGQQSSDRDDARYAAAVDAVFAASFSQAAWAA